MTGRCSATEVDWGSAHSTAQHFARNPPSGILYPGSEKRGDPAKWRRAGERDWDFGHGGDICDPPVLGDSSGVTTGRAMPRPSTQAPRTRERRRVRPAVAASSRTRLGPRETARTVCDWPVFAKQGRLGIRPLTAQHFARRPPSGILYPGSEKRGDPAKWRRAGERDWDFGHGGDICDPPVLGDSSGLTNRSGDAATEHVSASNSRATPCQTWPRARERGWDLGRPRGRPVTGRCSATEVDSGSAHSQPSTSRGIRYPDFLVRDRRREATRQSDCELANAVGTSGTVRTPVILQCSAIQSGVTNCSGVTFTQLTRVPVAHNPDA